MVPQAVEQKNSFPILVAKEEPVSQPAPVTALLFKLSSPVNGPVAEPALVNAPVEEKKIEEV